MKDLVFEQVGDIVKASGKGWDYERVGNFSIFTQYGKTPSIRAVKLFLKSLERAGE